MQNSYNGSGLCLPDGMPSELDESDYGLFEEFPVSNCHHDDSQPPSDVEAGNMLDLYQDDSLLLPSCEWDDNDSSDLGMFEELPAFDEEANSHNDSSQQRSVTLDVKVGPTKVSSIHLGEKLQQIATVNEYPVYPSLQPWGRHYRFHYDDVGQLASDVVFDEETMYEYLYNHPLGKKLIIWVQRHPSQAQLIYDTNYGGSCRYTGCRPGKRPSRSIQVGHYRLAFDELTPRFPRHKANSYLHAAFFHVSCFEKMFDLADICRQFDVRCEDRPFINRPIGDRTYIKNKMLLEERRIPHATAEWIVNARKNPSWKTSCAEDSLNFLLFKKKWELRPHRKKCTDVPGMECLGDISHLAKARPVKPNTVWGGKRVKGLTVVQLQAIESQKEKIADQQREDRLKRKRARPGDNDGDNDGDDNDNDNDEYLPPAKHFQSRSGYTANKESPIVIDSSRTPSPVRFVRPGRGRDDPPRDKHKSISPKPVLQVEPFTTLPQPGPVQQNLWSNVENDIYPPVGSMIKTAYGWYVREPTTGAMVQVLNVVTPSATVPPTPSLVAPSQTFDNGYPPATGAYNLGLWTPQSINTQHDSMDDQQQFIPETLIDPLLLNEPTLPPMTPVAPTVNTPTEEEEDTAQDKDLDLELELEQFSVSPLTMEDFLFVEELMPTDPMIYENEYLDDLQFSIDDAQTPPPSDETEFDPLDDFLNPDMYLLFCD